MHKNIIYPIEKTEGKRNENVKKIFTDYVTINEIFLNLLYDDEERVTS
mgnify:CR=1 FL=1